MSPDVGSRVTLQDDVGWRSDDDEDKKYMPETESECWSSVSAAHVSVAPRALVS